MATNAESDHQGRLDALFFSHLNELAVQAQLFLGRIPHPQTGQAMYDPDLARQTIDTLVAIVGRCSSTLERTEKAQIDQMLDQLRMLYVEAAGQPMPSPESVESGDSVPVEDKPAEEPSPAAPEKAPAPSPAVEEEHERKVRFQKRYG